MAALMGTKRIATPVRRLGLWFVLAAALPAMANINLEWRPASQVVYVNDLVEIGLYAVSDDPETDQLLAAVDMIFTWDPLDLQLVGVDDPSGTSWLFSGFPANDPYGLNEVVPPQDGDGLYTLWAHLGEPIAATPEGTLLTTFQFTALRPATSTIVDILESGGDPVGYTVVWDGTTPNHDVTGTLGNAEVAVFCMECPGDLNGDGVVNLADLAQLLTHYGTTSGAEPQDGDLDCDGDVELSDLAALLAVYATECP